MSLSPHYALLTCALICLSRGLKSMRMAHILKMFDLHPIFVVPIGKTSRAGCVRFFGFYLSRFDTVHQNTKLFSQNRLPGIAQICYQLKILISTQHLFQKKKNVFFILWTGSAHLFKFMFLSLAFFFRFVQNNLSIYVSSIDQAQWIGCLI